MPGSSVSPDKLDSLVVLDSWPVMEWLKGRQPVANYVFTLLDAARRGDKTPLMSTINLGEVFYNCWQEWDEDRAEATLIGMRDLPVLFIHPEEADALAAARIKGRYKISYADAFTAVLAIEFSASVLTGDPDFQKLQRADLIDVEWLSR